MGTFCAKPRASDQLSSPPPEGLTATGRYGSSTPHGAGGKDSAVRSSTSKTSSRRWRRLNKSAGEKLAPCADRETLDGADFRSLAQSDDRNPPLSFDGSSLFMMSLASVASNVVTAVKQQVMLSGLIEGVAQTPGGQDSTQSTLMRSSHFTADGRSIAGDYHSVTGDCRSVAGSSVYRNVVDVHEAEDSGVDDSDESNCYGNSHTADTRDGVTLIRVGTKANKPASRQSSGADSVEVPAADSTLQLPPDECVGPEVSYDNIDTGSDKMSGIGDLAITKPAPQFEAQAVVDGEFKTVKLTDYRGKYVVLFFYPLDFTFVCPTEIISFSDRAADFRGINCEVLACSTDSVFSHLAWINTPRKQGGLGPMNIPLIADKNAEISKKYGCLKGDEGIAFRGLYIIDDKGNLRQITINDLPVGRSVDETLRLVQAFQFTDKHGEVCPAGWKPGSETLKPNAKGISEYLSKH